MKKYYIGLLSCFALLATNSEACTGITIKTKDNKQIQARTIEWGENVLKSNIIVTPRDYKYQAIIIYLNFSTIYNLNNYIISFSV